MSNSPSKPERETSPPRTRAVSGCGLSQSDQDKIYKLARAFAADIQQVLNATVCNNASINAQQYPRDPSRVAIGNRLPRDGINGELLPLCARGKPRGWLKVEYTVQFDEAIQYLMVSTAFIGVYAADEDRSELCHFDYERNKGHGYPEAHVQVNGTSDALGTWGDQFVDRGLHRLHFPAGHRRFRWILEDVIEFLVSEKLAEPHDEDHWQDALKPGRKKYMRTQLRAAIRNDTETAVEYLNEHDYEVKPKGAVKAKLDKLRRRSKKKDT